MIIITMIHWAFTMCHLWYVVCYATLGICFYFHKQGTLGSGKLTWPSQSTARKWQKWDEWYQCNIYGMFHSPDIFSSALLKYFSETIKFTYLMLVNFFLYTHRMVCNPKPLFYSRTHSILPNKFHTHKQAFFPFKNFYWIYEHKK